MTTKQEHRSFKKSLSKKPTLQKKTSKKLSNSRTTAPARFLEEKNNNAAFALIIASSLLVGFITLVGAATEEFHVPMGLITVVGYFSALIAGISFSKVLGLNIFQEVSSIMSVPKIKTLFLYRILSGFGFPLFFAGLFIVSNKVLAPLLYEVSPVVSIIISYFMMKNYYRQEKNKLTTWALISISVIGVFLLPAKNLISSTILIPDELYGYALIIAGGVMRAFATVISPKINLTIKNHYPQKSLINISAISQLIIVGFILLFAIIYAALSYDIAEFRSILHPKFLALMFIFGLLEYFSNILTKISGSIAESHNIYMGRLITPIIGVVLLWLFGYGDIEYIILLSLALIIIPNILLNLNTSKIGNSYLSIFSKRK